MAGVEPFVEDSFESLTKSSVRNPYKAISGVLIFVVACLCGFANFRVSFIFFSFLAIICTSYIIYEYICRKLQPVKIFGLQQIQQSKKLMHLETKIMLQMGKLV